MALTHRGVEPDPWTASDQAEFQVRQNPVSTRSPIRMVWCFMFLPSWYLD
jgi:hypothetical protein